MAAVAASSTIELGAQEPDKAVFHYSRLALDASRSEGPTVGRWHAAGWIGTDFDRLWWRTSGERADDAFHEAEAMALYGKYVRRFWDVVVGYRQDLEPTTQGYLGLGVVGLAPYWFEVELMGFVSDRGRPSVRFEADNDMFVTQRLVVVPSARLDWLLATDQELDTSAGLGYVELGVRARYEVRRKVAPYLDLTWVREKEPRTGPGTRAGTEGLRIGAGVRLIH